MFVGCGSSDSTSTSAVSGTAVKAPLNGASVTVGANTVKSDENGSWSTTKAAGAATVTVTDGNYTHNNQVVVNKMVMKGVLASGDTTMEVNTLTTLMKRFEDAGQDAAESKRRAFNALGITSDPATTDISTLDADEFEAVASRIALVIGDSEGNDDAAEAFIKSLSLSAKNGQLSLAGLMAALTTAQTAAIEEDSTITEIPANVLTALGDPSLPLGALSAMIENNATTLAGSGLTLAELASNNVINLEGNSSSDAIGYWYTGATQNATMARLGGALNATGKIEDNSTEIGFALKDYDSSFSGAGTASLFITMKGLDTSNANYSYKMVLSGLDATASNDIITINENATAQLHLTATSSTGYTLSNTNTSATKILAADIVEGIEGDTVVGLATFINYMASEDIDGDLDAATVGDFKTGFESGNFSTKVYVNIDNKKMSRDDRLFDIIPSTLQIGQSDDTNTKATAYTGYKILDTNLTY